MKTPFKTRINAKESIAIPSIGISETVPDQSWSMREILSKYSRGILPSQSAKIAVYNPDHTLPDLNTMDLVDIQEHKQNLQDEIARKNFELEDIRQAQLQRAKKAKADAQVQEADTDPNPTT